jgi:hypothetical protein
MILLIVLFNTDKIKAQDRIFTYTYQSSVLNKGQREIEVWNTLRTGRDDFFSRLDHRTEFEFGLGNRLQTAFYLNLSSKSQVDPASENSSIETENELSFSNEWKLKFLDPVADPLGLALYGEYGIGSKEYEFEGKLILDKQFGKFALVANAVYELELEPEIETEGIEWEKEHKNDYFLALGYSFNPRFHLTCENMIRNVFEEGNLLHSGLFSGLGFSWAQQHTWVNFTIMPQLASLKKQLVGSLDLTEFEKVQFRLLFSYVF